jgi:hypothetical protein
MKAESHTLRYEMVNVQPGYIVVEHETFSGATRAFFSAEPSPPLEEYREGSEIWRNAGVAQSFRFDIRDTATGELTSFPELMGLAYFASCRPGSEIYVLGEMAQENRISVYVAVGFGVGRGSRTGVPVEKLKVLNRYFNERLQQREKKILVLPDYFNLSQEFSAGLIMADLGLTAME